MIKGISPPILQVVREGRGLLQIPDAPPIRIEEPTLIFMSGPMALGSTLGP